MSEEKIKSIENVLESLNETERNGILGVILDFLNVEYKKAFAENLGEKTVYSLFVSVMCLTNFCEPEFEIAKDSSIFKKIYNLLIKSKNERKIDQDLHRIYSNQKTTSIKKDNRKQMG